jgi:pimeloyl-ACP methyl ester carboxylesterase
MLHEVNTRSAESGPVYVDTDDVRLAGDLSIPPSASGVVIFAHGSGSSRHSPRNRFVAQTLREEARCATLLVDLLSEAEEAIDDRTAKLRFDIPMLARRVEAMCDWAKRDSRTRALPLGLFGASTGAAAALIAAADRPDDVAAVVSRGGRPDLAGAAALAIVRAPTLLIVGGDDLVVLELNGEAMRAMRSSMTKLEVVPGASHLFEEPGTLDAAARAASGWFAHHFRRVSK